ncbi:MAG: hypothetical protein JMM76_00475 [Candidatus Xiphinematobacter sp.]|nr:MAG: hypothetical protein JMM76_00475 [Candidatus Xiphinematobacter sp.]QQY09945.1 MAG: hypothetical protein JMM78_00485 [Candidatus Xiphinematobacter sp.]QQY10679.1 MAG: hypothetical protein JMM74_00470 [Candidatus Xiphinematobacter sp.]QQY11422.1 MAG: hypothetical protein JMM77_00495 [Candidatus Xiphinematobacter sp.]
MREHTDVNGSILQKMQAIDVPMDLFIPRDKMDRVNVFQGRHLRKKIPRRGKGNLTNRFDG